MTKAPLRVVIIGAGTGGLCLAQGLKSNNIAVEVFERDHSPSDRLQGYRLNQPSGQPSAQILPTAALFEKLVNNSANQARLSHFSIIN